MAAHSTTPAPRQDNRRQQLLDTAARLFRQHGYHATSMRDIASAVGMLPGSIYYHFASKDELLVTVYREGVSRIAERLDAAVAGKKEPWQQLEAACIAHLQTVLDHSDYAQVVIRVLPDDAPAVRVRLAALRDQYEERFKDLVAALDLPAYVDRHYLRLLLLGALNWSQVWYRRGGDSPRTIAKRFLQVLHGIQAQQR
ncbi:MAG: TetR/AcrR family transcriptional regulator [Nitrospira sp.]|jgi:AcrR family transcriptional regulator|nr:TetR/AcrR family transcriptional regulator [Nitrospira sp.]